MEKKIAFSFKGQLAKVGELTVNRLLPNRYIQAIGPFVFLDHLLPTVVEPKKPSAPTGDFAHPHRGIATFSYLFNGELEHFDSRGHKGIVGSGGAQWMNAGNGIIHDENQTKRFQETGGLLHGLQFWINLPAKNKAEAPGYLALQSANVPEINLPGNAGVLRVLIGEYEGSTSPVQTFTKQFNYHIKLNAGAAFNFKASSVLEYAAFIPQHEIIINQSIHGDGEFLVFDADGTDINFINNDTEQVDIIVFGGEPHAEPIFAQGPFVMNEELEIAHAYRDYMNGKYGIISYV